MPAAGSHARCHAFVCLGLLLFASASGAQSVPAAAEPEGIAPVLEDGRQVYSVEQFSRFAPQSAADVVAQIPGFSVTGVSNDRGIGEATQNVLINGQRITGKGNDAMTVLRRVPATAVQRLEIVDGATLDISGLSGQVLNVVTESGGVQGNFIWRPQIREQVPAHWTAGEVNLSGKAGYGDFTLGLRWDGFRGGGWGGETQVNATNGTTLWRAQEPRFAQDIPKLSGSYSRTTAQGSIWNLNASLQREEFRRRVPTQFQLSGEPLTTELSTGTNEKWRTEIGADHEFALGAGRFKLVGFFTERWGPNNNELTTSQAGDVLSGTRFVRDATEGERVARVEYRWRDLGSDWSLTGEVAHNFVDATSELAVTDENDVFQPVSFPDASSRVEEMRGESILSFSRTLSPAWSMQLGGGVEYSQLRQDGEDGQTRSFWRPKGTLSLAWNPDAAWEFDLRLQRKVGQLNFYDFLASVDVNDNTANDNNPELVPPQSWLTGVEATRNLGAAGKVRLNMEAEFISDIVDQVPIDPVLHTEAVGNLASAQRFSVSLDAGLVLDALGIPGGKLDAYFTVRDTRVRDPLSGAYRELNGNRYYWNVDFRHDVPRTNWTWGVFAEYQSHNHSWRLDSQGSFWGSRPFGQVFLEHKDVFGLKVRAAVANFLNSRDRSREVSYVGWRDGPVDYTRDFRLTFHPMLRLQVSGTF